MLVIHDEQLVKQLQQIAEQEQRSVEDVLFDFVKGRVAQHPAKTTDEQATSGMSETVKRVRRKAYAKARQYWQSVGDVEKAAMTDEALDEQFGMFDEEGIPRLKSELKSLEPPVGSLAYAAKMAREANIHTGKPFSAADADDILNEEFADYLLSQRRDENAAE